MPCYTRFSITTKFQGGDIEALIATLEELNIGSHSGNAIRKHAESIIRLGRITLVGRAAEDHPEVLDQIKKSYAERVVTKQAKQRGYRVNKNQRTGKLELTR